MINTQLEHVPLPIKEEVLDETLEQQTNDSDETEETDGIEDETTLMISSDEEAELEAQRIRFHELVRFHKWVGKNLQLRERGRPRSTSSSGSSVVMLSSSPGAEQQQQERKNYSEINGADANAITKHGRKRLAGQLESCGNIFIYSEEAMLIFHCSFCDLRYAEMSGFARHLHEAHKLFMEPQPPEHKNARTIGETSRDDDAAEVKQECGLSAPIEIPDPLESCGNVFILKQQKLLLICGYCEYKYATLELFTIHLRQQHQLLERPVKKVVDPKPEVKEEVFVITMLPSNTDENQTTPRPMVAIPPQHITLDNNDLLPMPTIYCSSRSSHSSRELPSPVRVSPEISLPEEGESILPDNSTEEIVPTTTAATTLPRKKGRPKGSRNKDLTRKDKLNTDREKSKNMSSEVSSIAAQPKVNVKKRTKSSSSQNVEQQEVAGATATVTDFSTQPPSLPQPIIIKRFNLNLMEEKSTTTSDSITQQNMPTISNKSPVTQGKGQPRQPRLKIIYQCDICEKQYQKYHQLVDHVRVHTGEKPFKCNLCGKQFRLKMRLGDHLLRHRTEKLFKCNICGIGLSTRPDLVLHQRHHNGDRRHTCSQCPKAFVRYSDLKIHMRVHTGEKPFKCEICEKAFRANQNLIHHRKTHLGDKPYRCDFCDKSFMRNIDRKVHYRTHSTEKAFKCEICGRGYSSRQHVRSHIQREHMPTDRVKKKSGPKPKHITTESEKQKEINDKLQIQVISETQPQNVKTVSVQNVRPFKCDFCEKVYTSRQNIQRHTQREHNKSSDRAENKKPGPKTKPINNEVEQQKELSEESQIQVINGVQLQPPNVDTIIATSQRNSPTQLKIQEKSKATEQPIVLSEAVLEQQVSLALKIALEDDGTGVLNVGDDETIQTLEKENDTPKVMEIVILNSDAAVSSFNKRTSGVIKHHHHHQQQKEQQFQEGGNDAPKTQHKITSYFTVRGQKTVT